MTHSPTTRQATPIISFFRSLSLSFGLAPRETVAVLTGLSTEGFFAGVETDVDVAPVMDARRPLPVVGVTVLPFPGVLLIKTPGVRLRPACHGLPVTEYTKMTSGQGNGFSPARKQTVSLQRDAVDAIR